MDLTTFETILVAVAPALSSVLTIIACVINMAIKFKKIVKNSDEKVAEANAKVQKAYKDIAIIKAKCESMEKVLKDKEQK